MSDQYRAAATRHYRDAELLEHHQRVENADYHYGFVAECGLKAALEQMGKLKPKHRKWHIDRLWGAMGRDSFRKGLPGLHKVLMKRDCFAKWTVDQRYREDGSVTPEDMLQHRECAIRVLKAVGISRG